MTLQLVKPEGVVASKYARWMIYGNNGTGKSTLARTMPKPLMVISALGENMTPYAGQDDIVINLLDDWDKIHETFQFLRSKDNPFKSVVFDTLTRIMGFYLDKIQGVRRSGVEWGAYLRSGKPSTIKRDWSTWENLGFMATQVVFDFNQLPMHTLYLCQEDTRQPEYEHATLEIRPMLSPASWKGVKDIVHLLGRLYVEEVTGGVIAPSQNGIRAINRQRKDQRVLLIGQHEPYSSKGDTETLGFAVVNPSWDNLKAALK